MTSAVEKEKGTRYNTASNGAFVLEGREFSSEEKNTALVTHIFLCSISNAVTYLNALFTVTSKHVYVTVFVTFHHIYCVKPILIIVMQFIWIECLSFIYGRALYQPIHKIQSRLLPVHFWHTK